MRRYSVDQDRKLFVMFVGVLLGFGILMVHSASITSRPSAAEQTFLSRHAAFVAFGLMAAAIASLAPARVWKTGAPWLFGATVLLLVLVLVPGLGTRVNGAQRWFRHGALSFQPAELVKL